MEEVKKETKNEEGGLQSFLDILLRRVKGLQAVIVSDRDGVTVAGSVVDEQYADNMTLASMYFHGAEQVGKLNLGRTTSLMLFSEDQTVIQVSVAPALLTTLISEPNSNVGVLLDQAPELVKALGPLSLAVGKLESNRDK